MGQAGDILSHNHSLISLDAAVAEHPGPNGHHVAVNDCCRVGCSSFLDSRRRWGSFHSPLVT
jgi:hypothetical protein